MTNLDQSAWKCFQITPLKTLANHLKFCKTVLEKLQTIVCMSGLKGHLHVWLLHPQLPNYPSTPSNDCKWPSERLANSVTKSTPIFVQGDKRQSGVQRNNFQIFFDVVLHTKSNLGRRLPGKQPWNELYPVLPFFMHALSGKLGLHWGIVLYCMVWFS